MVLIPSSRHRPEDLALWRRLEMADRLNYLLRRVENRIPRALECLRRFIKEGTCYNSISWGKDSLVTTHLLWCLQQEWAPASRITTYRVFMPGIETPGTNEVEAEFLRRWPLLYQRVEVPHDPKWIREEDKREKALTLGIAKANRLAETNRWIGGLRATESVVRRLGMRKGGVHGTSCWPLASWRVQDVFAYLAYHDLPVHPNYAMTGGGFWKRDSLRVCMLGNYRGRRHGRLLWEEWYYGDVLEEMRRQHPNMVPKS